jgi:hypothetical protein
MIRSTTVHLSTRSSQVLSPGALPRIERVGLGGPPGSGLDVLDASERRHDRLFRVAERP